MSKYSIELIYILDSFRFVLDLNDTMLSIHHITV